MSEQAKREAIEARDVVDIDALIRQVDEQRKQIVEMAGHYVFAEQHPQAAHIYTYLNTAREVLGTVSMLLANARNWIPQDDGGDDE